MFVIITIIIVIVIIIAIIILIYEGYRIMFYITQTIRYIVTNLAKECMHKAIPKTPAT